MILKLTNTLESCIAPTRGSLNGEDIAPQMKELSKTRGEIRNQLRRYRKDMVAAKDQMQAAGHAV